MESINPKDMSDLEPGSISFITMKNGTMIVLDESVPEKTKNHKEKKTSINEKIDSKLDSKKSNKKLIFEISPKITVDYKGESKTKNEEKTKGKINEENIKIKIQKSDFNKCSSISKNNNFSFAASKKTENVQKKNSDVLEKFLNLKPSSETKQPSLNNNITKDKKENDNQSQTNALNTNSINSNSNNSKSIAQDKDKSISKDNLLNNNFIKDLINLNNNTNKTAGGERKSIYVQRRQSRLQAFARKDKGHSIHVVCSLNLLADGPCKVNLIGQFNNLVDRLNGLKMNSPEPENNYKRYYELYKYKDNGNTKNKNYIKYRSSNKKLTIDKNMEFKNGSPFHLSATNFYNPNKLNSISNKNKIINDSINLTEIFQNNNRNKINPVNINNNNQLFSSQIVFPSNNFRNNFKINNDY